MCISFENENEVNIFVLTYCLNIDNIIPIFTNTTFSRNTVKHIE